MNSIKRLLFIYFLLLSSLMLLNARNSYSQQEDPTNPRTWTYFRIYASAEDDSIFVKVQDDLLIDPKMDRYTITKDRLIFKGFRGPRC